MRLTSLVVLLGIATVFGPVAALAQDTSEQEEKVVRMARATWDTGWFQAEVYRLLLMEIGYRVEGPQTMENEDFFSAVDTGAIDLWVNGWFPLHQPLLEGAPGAETVGVQVEGGALQGYMVDVATATEYGITNLGDLANPEIAALFDQTGNGRADLIGCNVGWACGPIIDHHLEVYGLTETVEHVQAEYSPLMLEVVDRQRSGEPVLFYTWTPNWTVGSLVPGNDVVWIETPFPSLPDDQGTSGSGTTVEGVAGCVGDPCQVGWEPSDIRVVANTSFLEDNPSVRRLLEQVEIPLADILHQNARMVDGEGDPADIRRHAREWLQANDALLAEWVHEADPDAVAITGSDGTGSASGSAIRVAVRIIPPFVMFEARAYEGFEVELARLIAARLGREVEIYGVDTVAKQIDDVSRGTADVALGGVVITRDREELIDFSLPFLHTGLAIMVPESGDEGFLAGIGSFFRTIANSALPGLLLVFGIAVIISAHLIWRLERGKNPDFAERYPRGIWDSFYWAVVTMSTVGYGDKVPRGDKGRLFTLLWIAAGTLVFASFTAAIASALAVDELRGSISGPGDLRGHRVATVTDSPGHTFLSSMGVGPVLAQDFDEALDFVTEGRVDALVFDAPVLRFHAITHGAGEVNVVGPDFDDVQYGVVVGRTDLELRKEINLALLDLIETGVYQQIHDKWFGSLR